MSEFEFDKLLAEEREEIKRQDEKDATRIYESIKNIRVKSWAQYFGFSDVYEMDGSPIYNKSIISELKSKINTYLQTEISPRLHVSSMSLETINKSGRKRDVTKIVVVYTPQ